VNDGGRPPTRASLVAGHPAAIARIATAARIRDATARRIDARTI
jgi:hypothetical protein